MLFATLVCMRKTVAMPQIVLSVQAPSSRHVSTRSPSRGYIRQPSSLKGSGGLWSIALAGFFVFLLVFWKNIVRILQGLGFKSRHTDSLRGKWIYDRSMGGRKVMEPTW